MDSNQRDLMDSNQTHLMDSNQRDLMDSNQRDLMDSNQTHLMYLNQRDLMDSNQRDFMDSNQSTQRKQNRTDFMFFISTTLNIKIIFAAPTWGIIIYLILFKSLHVSIMGFQPLEGLHDYNHTSRRSSSLAPSSPILVCFITQCQHPGSSSKSS